MTQQHIAPTPPILTVDFNMGDLAVIGPDDPPLKVGDRLVAWCFDDIPPIWLRARVTRTEPAMRDGHTVIYFDTYGKRGEPIGDIDWSHGSTRIRFKDNWAWCDYVPGWDDDE